MYRRPNVPPQMFSMLGMQQMDPRMMALLGNGMGAPGMPPQFNAPMAPGDDNQYGGPAIGDDGGNGGGGNGGGGNGGDDDKGGKGDGKSKWLVPMNPPPIKWAFPQYSQRWAFDLPKIPKDQRMTPKK